MTRTLVALAPLVINALACAMFLLTRPPDTTLIEERERAEQAGGMAISSADPYMLIAERPLKQWNDWHGGEAAWVKFFEVLNCPALMAAEKVGDRWASHHALSGMPIARRESWIRAYAFATVAFLQWLLIGLLTTLLMKRRRVLQNGRQTAEAG